MKKVATIILKWISQVSINFENGMLKIVVPKKEEAQDTKKMIEIK